MGGAVLFAVALLLILTGFAIAGRFSWDVLGGLTLCTVAAFYLIDALNRRSP